MNSVQSALERVRKYKQYLMNEERRLMRSIEKRSTGHLDSTNVILYQMDVLPTEVDWVGPRR